MDSVLRELQEELGDRYEVLHEIGRGGMAVVFLAVDLRHARRRVALKVLRRDLGFSTDDQRFLHEIETIATLDHPHIIPMYDSGKAGDALFYVMPFVEGESLRQRLEREGALPLDEAVRICREVADALDYAHALGVVHRDIKPENILLSAGHARVTDFGIARAISAAGVRLTDTGLAVGTPAYMSPEQALADPHLDGRSDQYALGCVVYETLAGVPPFQGSDSRALMARHTSDAVPPLTTVRSVTPLLDEAVRRALAKQRADRWPSAGAFAAALSDSLPTPARSRSDARGRDRRRSVLAAVGFVAAAAGLSIWLGIQSGAKRVAEDRSSVAVLPATFSGDSAGALFADGLTEAIITGLVRVPGIRIPASSRVAPLSGTQLEPRDAGRSLGVQSVVTTAVQVAANRLRVTAQLVRVSDGTIVWREAFDGELESHGLLADVFPIYDDLASKLVSAVAPHLAPGARNVAARGLRATDPEAYQYFLRARRLNLSAGSLGAASDALSIADSTIVLLREAIRRDTLFSDAWATLADALLWREALAGLPPAGVVADVSEAVGRALTIDSTSADAYARRAEIYRTHDWDWDRADRDFRRAVQLAPSSAEITGWYAAHLAVAGQVDSAIAVARYALTQDPTNSWLLTSQGMNYAYAGNSDSAFAFSRRAVALDSAQFLAYWVLAHVHLNRGQRTAADNAIENFLRFSARGPDIVAYAAHYYRRSNNTAAVARLRKELTSRSRRQYVPAVNLAVTALAAGDTTEALAALVVAERDRDRFLMTNLAHLLYPLRGKPQYDGLVRRVYGNRPLNTPFR